MAYDEKLANRLRAAFARTLAPEDDIEERKMFGGIGEMVNGHMCVGIHKEDLVVHVRAQDAESALARPYARPMDITGRPMKGWIFVSPPGYATDADLDGWIRSALAFVHEAGPKQAGSKPMKRISGAKKTTKRPMVAAPPQPPKAKKIKTGAMAAKNASSKNVAAKRG